MTATAFQWALWVPLGLLAGYYAIRAVIWVIDFVIDSCERWEG